MRTYLDHNATTPLRPEVVDAMLPALRDGYGNPSSTHEEGAAARRCVESARADVAALLGASPREVVFTAGATEANNTVLFSLTSDATPWTRLITTEVEHPSVREPAAALEAQGVPVRWLSVDEAGRLDVAELEADLAENGPALVSVIGANNETGVLAPLAEIAKCVRAADSWLHVDVTQALGKTNVSDWASGAQFLSASAHKLNGPKGTGCLVVRDAPALPALMQGGPQERRARGGTENVAGMAGFGRACSLALAELDARTERYAELRDRLWGGLEAKLGDVRWNGLEAGRENILANTLNVEIAGAAADVLLQALDLDGVAVSSGAACHSGSIDPSHVLSAMGRTPEQARATLRLSVGYGNDEAQIDAAIAAITELAPRARAAGL